MTSNDKKIKLVINIPCLNEEKTLPQVLKELPKSVPGVDVIEVQIVDDGSSDNTASVAKKFGAIVLRHKQNQGLGFAFKTGQKAALSRGADIFINTDADNQYPARYIPDLVKPILADEADIVIGNREPWKIKHFGLVKRFFQFVGNRVIGELTRTKVPDLVSGYRAYNRDALRKLNVTTRFSYVLDTIVQASHKGLVITSVKIKTNAPTRKSRLFTNIFQHMLKTGHNVSRVMIIYEPFKAFMIPTVLIGTLSFALFFRFAWFFFQGDGSGHIQSLIIAAVLATIAGLLFVMGVLAGLIGINRMLIEEQKNQ